MSCDMKINILNFPIFLRQICQMTIIIANDTITRYYAPILKTLIKIVKVYLNGNDNDRLYLLISNK